MTVFDALGMIREFRKRPPEKWTWLRYTLHMERILRDICNDLSVPALWTLVRMLGWRVRSCQGNADHPGTILRRLVDRREALGLERPKDDPEDGFGRRGRDIRRKYAA